MGGKGGQWGLWEGRETCAKRKEVVEERAERDFKRAGIERPPLQPARRAPAERLPHQNAEIERAGVDEEPFENVLVTTEMRPPHPAGVIDVGERALDVLSAPAHQPSAAGPVHAPAIAVDRGLRLGGRRPAATAALGLAQLAAHPDRAEIGQHLTSLIPA